MKYRKGLEEVGKAIGFFMVSYGVRKMSYELHLFIIVSGVVATALGLFAFTVWGEKREKRKKLAKEE